MPPAIRLGFACLAYENIWKPIADKVKAANDVKLEDERKLAELVGKSSPILEDSRIHGFHAADFKNLELEDEWDEEQEREASLDQAQTLVERASQTLNTPGQGHLTDKGEGTDSHARGETSG